MANTAGSYTNIYGQHRRLKCRRADDDDLDDGNRAVDGSRAGQICVCVVYAVVAPAVLNTASQWHAFTWTALCCGPFVYILRFWFTLLCYLKFCSKKQQLRYPPVVCLC